MNNRLRQNERPHDPPSVHRYRAFSAANHVGFWHGAASSGAPRRCVRRLTSLDWAKLASRRVRSDPPSRIFNILTRVTSTAVQWVSAWPDASRWCSDGKAAANTAETWLATVSSAGTAVGRPSTRPVQLNLLEKPMGAASLSTGALRSPAGSQLPSSSPARARMSCVLGARPEAG
jgi:hypothetical protein